MDEKKHENTLFVCFKDAALRALPHWLKARPKFNSVDSDRKDKRGSPIIVMQYDWNGEVDRGTKSVVVCTQDTHEKAVGIVLQHMRESQNAG
jgi:hypothetical protein